MCYISRDSVPLRSNQTVQWKESKVVYTTFKWGKIPFFTQSNVIRLTLYLPRSATRRVMGKSNNKSQFTKWFMVRFYIYPKLSELWAYYMPNTSAKRRRGGSGSAERERRRHSRTQHSGRQSNVSAVRNQKYHFPYHFLHFPYHPKNNQKNIQIPGKYREM